MCHLDKRDKRGSVYKTRITKSPQRSRHDRRRNGWNMVLSIWMFCMGPWCRRRFRLCQVTLRNEAVTLATCHRCVDRCYLDSAYMMCKTHSKTFSFADLLFPAHCADAINDKFSLQFQTTRKRGCHSPPKVLSSSRTDLSSPARVLAGASSSDSELLGSE